VVANFDLFCLDNSVFKYHYLCRNNTSLLCFTDNSYLCICDENHTRAECFGYDDSLDRCSSCLADAQCLKGNQSLIDFICLCPRCYSGNMCQFNSESFSFTLDQLLSANLVSERAMEKEITRFSLIFGSWLLFLLGLVTNICSFVTFRRPKCRRIGTGHYLLCMSIVNQINLFCFALRLTHLVLNTQSQSYPLFSMVGCKMLNYLLVASSRISYWLVALIAIERGYITLFLNGQRLKKPSTAKRLIVFMFIVILSSGSYELYFIQSHVDSNVNKGAICTLQFPRQHRFWTQIHQAVTIIYAVVPFLITLCCTIIISCVVIKKRMNVNALSVCKSL
jgi:hypothetical protein